MALRFSVYTLVYSLLVHGILWVLQTLLIFTSFSNVTSQKCIIDNINIKTTNVQINAVGFFQFSIYTHKKSNLENQTTKNDQFVRWTKNVTFIYRDFSVYTSDLLLKENVTWISLKDNFPTGTRVNCACKFWGHITLF